MSNEKLTVTIGIPAYNEEGNIMYLIREILKQKESNFTLKKVLVVSDGSSDNTVRYVSNFKDKRIIAIDNKERKGATERQNQIIKMTNTDVLILLNADITIKGTSFIHNLINPIITHNANLVSSKLITIKPESFFEKILYVTHELKNEIYESIRSGKNVYTCHGAARAFSKSFYKNFKFINKAGEDAYSYLYCIKNKLNYYYQKYSVAAIKVPNNLKDHEKQSVRYFNSQKILKSVFGEKFCDKEYELPISIVLNKSIKYLFRHPFEIVAYVPIVLSSKIKSAFTKEISGSWSTSPSSKILHDKFYVKKIA